MTDTPETHPEPEKNPVPNPEPYKVGYGKPPRHTQWKLDQSGNPSGRRKRVEEPYSDLIDRIGRDVILTESNG